MMNYLMILRFEDLKIECVTLSLSKSKNTANHKNNSFAFSRLCVRFK